MNFFYINEDIYSLTMFSDLYVLPISPNGIFHMDCYETKHPDIRRLASSKVKYLSCDNLGGLVVDTDIQLKLIVLVKTLTPDSISNAQLRSLNNCLINKTNVGNPIFDNGFRHQFNKRFEYDAPTEYDGSIFIGAPPTDGLITRMSDLITGWNGEIYFYDNQLSKESLNVKASCNTAS